MIVKQHAHYQTSHPHDNRPIGTTFEKSDEARKGPIFKSWFSDRSWRCAFPASCMKMETGGKNKPYWRKKFVPSLAGVVLLHIDHVQN